MYYYAYAHIPRWKYRYTFRQDVSTSKYVYTLGYKLKVLHLATLPPAKEKLQLCLQKSQNIVYRNETINSKLFL